MSYSSTPETIRRDLAGALPPHSASTCAASRRSSRKNRSLAGTRAFFRRWRSLAHGEAAIEIRRAIEFDPASIRSNALATSLLLFTRRFDEAIELAQRGFEFEPNAFALAFQGMAYAEQGRLTEAVEKTKAATASCLHISGNGLVESRMYAMVHIAIHDAANAIERHSRPYVFDSQASGAASLDAAIAAAARDVLVSVISTLPESPECRASGIANANGSYATALGTIPNGPAEDNAIAVGQASAAAIIALRANDGSDAPLVDFDYPQGTQPGEWRFTPDFPFPLAFGQNWANVTPFALRRNSQFRPQPPYHVESTKYAADYNEIKLLGGDNLTTPSIRTPDRTEIGLFWLESSPLAWNRLARAVSVSRSLDLWENARLFGLLNLAMADGYIATVEAKYHYNFWRPITAIRLGDSDGNPDTVGEPDWTPLQPTYPFPDHDSGHAVQGGAAAEVLKQVFGTDNIPFTACSTTVGPGQTCADASPVLRVYSSFTEAADENAVSLIYIGIHCRRAVDEGVQHGRKIAAYVVHQLLKPAIGDIADISFATSH